MTYVLLSHLGVYFTLPNTSAWSQSKEKLKLKLLKNGQNYETRLLWKRNWKSISCEGLSPHLQFLDNNTYITAMWIKYYKDNNTYKTVVWIKYYNVYALHMHIPVLRVSWTPNRWRSLLPFPFFVNIEVIVVIINVRF